MIDISMASKWIPALGKALLNIGETRKKEIASTAKELMFSPYDLVSVFVEPDIQPFNPADDSNSEDEMFRVPLYKFINGFIKENKANNDGRRHLFILGDAGMGKTSVLAMLKLAHMKSFFGKGYSCVAMKLGHDTLERVASIEDPQNTLLLLDSLDEDKESYLRVKERVLELLHNTQNFFRVIITCRTQFFPKTDDPSFNRQDRVKIESFTCPVKYLSLFNEVQVGSYLNKKYSNKGKINVARRAIDRIDDLKFRPLLLGYVDDIIDGIEPLHEFDVYSLIVNAWIDRECRKNEVTYSAGELLEVCKYIARFMAKSNSRTISAGSLSTQEYAPPKYYSNGNLLKNLGLVTIGGRTLLNRNSDGEFLFSHKSFQEFLVVLSLSDNLGWDFPASSELMHKFMLGAELDTKDLKGASLNSAMLKCINLKNSNLEMSDLSHTNFSEAKLTGANLRGANLRGADMSGADMSGACLENANLKGADLSSSDLRNCNLTGASLKCATLSKAVLSNSRLKYANFSGATLDGVDFNGADLTGAIFHGALLKNMNLNGVTILGTDFKNATLINVNLKVMVTDSNFKGVTVTNVPVI